MILHETYETYMTYILLASQNPFILPYGSIWHQPPEILKAVSRQGSRWSRPLANCKRNSKNFRMVLATRIKPGVDGQNQAQHMGSTPRKFDIEPKGFLSFRASISGEAC